MNPVAASSLTLCTLALAGALCAAPQEPAHAPPALVADGEMLRADGRLYRAHFDRDGATLITAEGAELTLRLVDWRRDAAGAANSDAAALDQPPARTSSRLASYRHDGIVERYESTACGFEQSFVLERRPAGDGDLVLGIEVQGNVRAPRRAAAHGPIDFATEEGQRVRYGAAVAFGRGGPRVDVATRYDGDGRIELIVPAALLDEASYPVIVDPAVGIVFNPGGASPNDFAPDTAQALLARRYMVVWRRDFGINQVIRAQVWNDDGTPASGTIVVTSLGDAQAPTVTHTVVNGADRFCVCFALADRIQARLYDLDGNPVTGIVPVTNPTAPESHGHPSVSSMHDSGVVLAWESTPGGPVLPSSTAGTNPTQIECRLLSFDNGTITGGVVRVIEAAPFGYVRGLRLARNHIVQNISGVEWVAVRAVWERFMPYPAPGDFDVRTASLRLSTPFGLQAVTLQPPAAVGGSGGVGTNEELPDIALTASTGVDPTDERSMIAWQDQNGDVRAAIYSLAGPLIAPIDIASTANFETEPAVTAGACEFVVAHREIGAAQSVLATAWDKAGNQITTTPVTLRWGVGQYYAIRGSSRHLRPDQQMPTNRVLFVWQDSDGPSSGIWDVQARFFQSVVGTSSPYGSACPGPGGTLPSIATIGSADPGNSQFGFELQNAPPNSLAVLIVSDQLTTTSLPGAPGCALYAGLPLLTIVPAVTNGAGVGSAAVPLPCIVPPGVTLAFQWGVLTPGHNPFGWITSDDIDITWHL